MKYAQPRHVERELRKLLRTKARSISISAGVGGGSSDPATWDGAGLVSAGSVLDVNPGSGLGIVGDAIALTDLSDFIATGADTITLTAAASATKGIAHGLTATPSFVAVSIKGNDNFAAMAYGQGATQFTARIRHLDGTAISLTVDIGWLAVL